MKCKYKAPFFAYEETPKRWAIVQGNCNHWDCPLHGEQVAKQHYGNIVYGARKLSENGVKLAFLTVTCKGKELSSDDAFKGYLKWTSRLFDAMRVKSKRAGDTAWAYCQVTEKQARSHPHSHVLLSFMPNDTVLGFVEKWKKERDGWKMTIIPALRSDWLGDEVVKAGLGEQYDLSEVETVEAASRYVAKYMFKRSQFTDKFPKGWKRVRYSQSWPKLPEQKSNAIPLLSLMDWANLSTQAAVIDARDTQSYWEALHYLSGQDIVIHQVTDKNSQGT